MDMALREVITSCEMYKALWTIMLGSDIERIREALIGHKMADHVQNDIFLSENRHAPLNWHSQDPSSEPWGVPCSRYTVLLPFLLSGWKCCGFYVDLNEFLKAALVVDPVLVSTSGDVLAGPSILATF